MDSEFKERFLQNWTTYFPGAELPIGFYYSQFSGIKIIWQKNLKDIVA